MVLIHGWLLSAGLAFSAAVAQDVTTRGANPEVRPPTFYSARILMEDGTAPPVEMTVRALGWCRIGNVFGNGTVMFTTEESNQFGHVRGAPDCSVWVMAPGVRSRYVTLRDGEVVPLKRLGANEGSMISMTVLKAPPPAKKAYAKGEDALLKKKYPEARKRLEEAVRLYPEYALAWSELGHAFEMLSLPDDARQAYRQAIQADRMYIKPLVQLAKLEAAGQNWPECVRAADAAIALHAVEFPGAYLYRGLAHFHAREWDRAIALSAKAIELDPNAELPQAHFLLAASLEQTGQRGAAAEVMQRFLDGTRDKVQAGRAREYLRGLGRVPN